MKRTVDKSGNTGGDNRPTRPVRGRRGGRHRGASAGRPTSHENPVPSRQNDAPEGQVGRGAASPLNNSARSIPSGTRRHSASGASAFIGPVAGNASNGSDNAPPSREGGELPDTGAWDASEKAEMIGQLNEYKVRCSNLEEKCGSLEVQVRVLTEAVRTAQASASEKEADNKRLEKLVEDLLSKNHELSQPRGTWGLRWLWRRGCPRLRRMRQGKLSPSKEATTVTGTGGVRWWTVTVPTLAMV